MRRPDPFERDGLEGRPVRRCLVIDAHSHLGENLGFPIVDATADGLIAAMDRMGIAVTCPSAMSGWRGVDSRSGNDLVRAAMRRHPGRVFGYMTADVAYPDRILPELRRAYAGGLRAVKIHTAAGLPYSHPNYDAVFRFADERGLPVLAHAFEPKELAHLEARLPRYPRIRLLLGHAGACGAEPYIRLALRYEQVYLETCFSKCPRGLIETFVSRGLNEKVLWGSDAVFMGAGHQLGRVLFARIAPADKARLLGGNAARILGLPPPGSRKPGP